MINPNQPSIHHTTFPRLNIGYDISQTGQFKAGCGHFAHAMIQSVMPLASEYNYTLYPSFGDFFFDPTFPRINPYLQGTLGPYLPTKESARTFWNHTQLEKKLNNTHILHANNFWCPTQRLKETKLIYTLYDLGFLSHSQWTTEANRIGCFEGVFRASICADWIVAISEHTKRHFLNLFPYFPEDRIQVIYPCTRFTDTSLLGKKPEALEQLEPQQFWLSVGTIEPRKNHYLLVTAYAEYLAQGGKPMPLILAGGEGWLMDDFQQHLASLNIQKHVILTGYIDDDTLIWLYRNCYAHLYPSHFEGFGLPVLESMQFGAPTLCSNTTSMPEITKKAALLLSPNVPEAWTQAMLTLSQSTTLKDQLSKAGQEQALTFNWQHSVEKLLSLYHTAWITPKRDIQ
ncbi:MAG: glycosyltransferase family 1 protein [Gammaproteobacteria bacterium]|nr:glycosyltransferase family 1 protein [Gammaproteobacteria bacterium]